MAKAEAICKCDTCGDEYTISKICANRAAANDFEEYAAEHYHECPNCYKARMVKERAEKNAAETAAAVETATSQGWATLTGTPKQIAWAETIRAGIITKAESGLQKSKASGRYPDAEIDKYSKMLSYMKYNIASAAVWIERRDNSDIISYAKKIIEGEK